MKKKFIVEYQCKESLMSYIPSEFKAKTFKTDIVAIDEHEAERFFQRFFPLASIVTISDSKEVCHD